MLLRESTFQTKFSIFACLRYNQHTCTRNENEDKDSEIYIMI